MKWISNAKYNQPATDGTVFKFEANQQIVIHHYIGMGDRWFLTCNELNYQMLDLATDDFYIAVKRAQDMIDRRVGEYVMKYRDFYTDTSEIEVAQ